MSIIFYLFIAFLSLSVLVFFHELGHYSAAKFFSVKVERFSIGFGKIMARKQWLDTEWVFSAIPLGGYVKMKGQDDADPTKKSYDGDSYNSKKPWQRIIILLAGPIANLILAFFVYLLIALSGAPAVVATDYLPPVVSKVQKDSPAQAAGILSGDRIVKVNNTPVTYWYEVGKTIRDSTGNITLTIERAGLIVNAVLNTKTIDSTNEFQEDIKKKIIGIQIDVSRDNRIEFSPLESLFYAWNETKKSATLIATGVKKMATGEIDSKHIGGAITIFDVIMKFTERGIVYLLFIMALISVNLGILNLLPIPALDGGHIMFNIYEMITRREPSETALYYLTVLGWAMLFGLMGLGLYNDVNRIWG
ncbi:MAG: RIP metalloprotease RseP [Sulfurovum sp.]|nr:RIP metalloprotease RseP [Sulfurovum sp.]